MVFYKITTFDEGSGQRVSLIRYTSLDGEWVSHVLTVNGWHEFSGWDTLPIEDHPTVEQFEGLIDR